jgi:hypothetical protein
MVKTKLICEGCLETLDSEQKIFPMIKLGKNVVLCENCKEIWDYLQNLE